MKKRIFLSISGVSIVFVLIINVILSMFMYESLFEITKQNIKNEAKLISQNLDNTNITNADIYLVSSNRITLIAPNGSVIYDNFYDAKTLDNHINRPEISDAITLKTGEAIRFSDTYEKTTYYYAMRLANGNILRISITQESIFKILITNLPLLILVFIIFVILTLYISKKLSQKIINPIYDLKNNIYDELDPYISKIVKQKEYISLQKSVLKERVHEFNVLTENIADGLIVLNNKREIISINENALNILDIDDALNKNILEINRSIDLNNAIDNALANIASEISIKKSKKTYILHISPVFFNNSVRGVFILFVDNTKKAEIEKLRHEFSSNVSHELKTPLTSILGYAELIKTGLVKPDDIIPFASKIHSESLHLLSLIDDILKISKLDEFYANIEFLPVNLKDVCETVISKLNFLDISLTVDIFDVEVLGILNVFTEIFNNLLENAIKYNKKDGNISVKFEKLDNHIKITITDTGVGIDSQSLERIFERFYRVDTSHSKEISGTGLGLSIVKHSVNLLNGNINVSSKLGVGTTFELYFNL